MAQHAGARVEPAGPPDTPSTCRCSGQRLHLYSLFDDDVYCGYGFAAPAIETPPPNVALYPITQSRAGMGVIYAQSASSIAAPSASPRSKSMGPPVPST